MAGQRRRACAAGLYGQRVTRHAWPDGQSTRNVWPASAAQAAGCLRLAGARGSLRHDLALKEASGEPAR
eukprot:scaffold88615_cov59-Phaeocystis_antarctica.AAC.2